MTSGTLVSKTLAPRIAEKIASHRVVLIKAPAEFLPMQIANDARTILHGADGFQRLDLPVQPRTMLAALRGARPLLITFRSEDIPGLLEMFEQNRPMREFWEGPPPAQIGRVVYVVQGDEVPDVIESTPKDLTLDHRALVAREHEVVRLHPVAAEEVAFQTLVEVTGGVPLLLTHPFNPGDDPLAYRSSLRQASLPWAERTYDKVMSDPLLSLSVWSGRLSPDTFCTLAGEALDLEVTPGEVSDAYATGLFTTINNHQPGMPDALARALGQLMHARDRDRHDKIRMGLASVASNNGELRALDRIQLLALIGDWEGLEHVLTYNLRLLAALNGPQRRRLLASLPHALSRRFARISIAREFLEGHWTHPDIPASLPRPWAELVFLAIGENEPKPGTLPAQARERVEAWLGHKPLDLLAARNEVMLVVDWLGEQAHAFEAQEAHNRCDDDLAYLIIMLLGGCDAMAVVGELSAAQACVRQALRLVRGQGVGSETYSTLAVSALGRSAYLAAASGLAHSTASRIDEYERALALRGEPDAEALRQVEIAKRFMALSASGLKAQSRMAAIDPELSFAPQEAEAEALRVLLTYGPSAGLEWLTGTISRIASSARAPWEWWPLHGIISLIEARLGRPGRAQQWLERSPLPAALDLCVRASIELAAGRLKAARNLADHVLNTIDVPNRWRLLATGVKLAATDAALPVDEAQREVMLGAEEWNDILGVLVLWPDRARAMVLPRLDAQAAKLNGLAVTDTPSPARRDVRLTPRQLDILEALSTGKTMTEIAKELYLGPETVRSTAKQMYRRLGVHDRDSAVQLGRALGLI